MYLKKEINFFFNYKKYICFKSWYGYKFFCWIFLFCSYVTQICSV
jgi:hypothetical protein